MRTGFAWSTALLSTLALLPTLALPAHSQAPVGPPLNAKVQETLMGPASPRVVLSPDGDHLAIVTAKGSRTVVLLDGVEGPAFDDIPLNFTWATYRGNTGSMVFSPTGGHSAYVGRRGGEFIAVVDGKEAVSLSTPALLQAVSYSSATGWKFAFSPDGSRLAYAALAAPGSWVMVVDGVKSPPYRAFDLNQMALNGKRLVYVAQTADQKWLAVVDGKPGPAYDGIAGMTLTPDGAHYAYVGTRSGGGATPRAVAVIDGVESTPYYAVSEVEQAPDGRLAYIATTNLGDGSGRGGAAELVIGALRVKAGTVTHNVSTYDKDRPGFRLGYQTRRVAFSPDGKRAAWVQRNTPNPGVTVMVDGKAMGPTYLSADELLWSPNGAHLTYQGTSPAGTFPVVDGEELSGYTWVKEFQWSPDGNRYVFQAAGATGLSIVVDGKEEPKTKGVVDGSFQWSADGKHLGYGGRPGVSVFQPMVDGVAKPHNLQDFGTRNNPKILFPILSFSPDGNHLAYVGLTMDPIPKGGVVVDGTMVPSPMPGAQFQFPTWSPDSKHFATAVWTGRGFTMMVDGKLGPPYEDMVVLSSAAVRFVDAQTVRFYGIKAGQIYRVTLGLGS
jgi:Tol biopolymer transport system component